jgi:hypothetical protein
MCIDLAVQAGAVRRLRFECVDVEDGHMSSFLLGTSFGVFLFIGFVAFRALRSGHWDNTNLTNVLRAISFFATHPDVFPYLIDYRQLELLGPSWSYQGSNRKMIFRFWYLPHDEFKGVVMTADSKGHKPGGLDV